MMSYSDLHAAFVQANIEKERYKRSSEEAARVLQNAAKQHNQELQNTLETLQQQNLQIKSMEDYIPVIEANNRQLVDEITKRTNSAVATIKQLNEEKQSLTDQLRDTEERLEACLLMNPVPTFKDA
jgi:hypothetical protein